MYADQPETDLIANALDTPVAAGAEAKTRFEDRFTAELRRLAEAGRELEAWEEENMLNALGAAGLGEFELALGFVEVARRPPARPSPPRRQVRDFRRLPMSVTTLRRRFERVCGASD